MSKVVNVKKASLNKIGYKDLEDWLKDDDHVYIGRNMSVYVKGANGSKWATPFNVKQYGRDGCLKKYREYIESNEELLKDLGELEGKVVGCWCFPENCHGDILMELVKERCVK